MLITFYTNMSAVGKMRIKLFGAGYFLSNYIFQAMHFKTQHLLRDEESRVMHSTFYYYIVIFFLTPFRTFKTHLQQFLIPLFPLLPIPTS